MISSVSGDFFSDYAVNRQFFPTLNPTSPPAPAITGGDFFNQAKRGFTMKPANLLKRHLTGLVALLFFTTLVLTGCGGGTTTSDDTTTTSSGVVNISLTDAEGDFASYTVDVLSMTLTRANGTVVETLPVQTRVDFAQYTDMTEFLTAATVPAGVYVKGSLKLDFSNADIWVEDANGNAVKVNSIVDEAGNPVTIMDTSVKLEGRNRLLIAPGIPMHLSLDFDLKASNTIVFNDTGEPEQTVKPVLIAEVERNSNKIQRLRGPLKTVNVDDGSFSVYLRPFYHRIRHQDRHFGSVNVVTGDATVYEINGESFQGAEGLQVLSEQTPLTAVIVRGSLKFRPARFEASEVYAGSSVPGGDMDVVRGSVVARRGDSVTLRGATLMRSNGAVVFNDTVTIQLADSTIIKKQLSLGSFGKDDISVGQRLVVFGTIINDAISDLVVDASNGYVRMQMTRLGGTVVTNDDTPAFDLNLTSINGRNVSLYDFAGTGVDTASDADPANYEVATSTLDVSAIGVDTRVAVRGFVSPFGQAPKDFEALTVIRAADASILPAPVPEPLPVETL